MRAICVDDEPLVLQLTASLCRELPQIDEVYSFAGPLEALDWLESNEADLALLDIDMPAMNGIKLAMKIKEMHPDIAIIFLTGYSQFALEAFSVHASGYLMKPISRDKLASEVEYALSKHMHRKPVAHIKVQTFGNFDVFVDGNPVSFPRSKSKELLAYLVDRRGSTVTRAEVFAALWEDALYDRAMQKQLDVIIRSLRNTLSDAGIPEIIDFQRGTMRVMPKSFDCDLYRLLEGDSEAANDFRGEYMSAYSWASLTEAYLDRFLGKME